MYTAQSIKTFTAHCAETQSSPLGEVILYTPGADVSQSGRMQRLINDKTHDQTRKTLHEERSRGEYGCTLKLRTKKAEFKVVFRLD